MPIIQPSRQFSGGDISSNVYGSIIKSGIRVINFRDDKVKDGCFFFILPPYKLDSQGRGVSWRVVSVRDNFGITTKETFAIGPHCPIAYFANQAKLLFPEYAKVEKTQEGGKSFTKYPTFGRQTNKVLFNAAYYNDLSAGSHVLTLPMFGGGAEKIEEFNRRKLPNGEYGPCINDPTCATPVFIQLKKNAIGTPWVVTPEPTGKTALPAALCDSAYLYNLDDVVHYPEPAELIEKLRSFTPSDIFNACMAKYSDGKVQVAVPASCPDLTPPQVAAPTAVPSTPTAPTAVPQSPAPQVIIPQAIIPQATIPTATIPQAVIPNQNVAPKEEAMPVFQAPAMSNPMAQSPAKLTVEQAKQYLYKSSASQGGV